MCLTLKQRFKTLKEAKEASKKPLIAKKDIIVYKSLYRNRTGGYTPFRQFQMAEGEHYYQTGKPFGFKLGHVSYGYYVSIHSGLHACINRQRAARIDGNLTVKMIVPKGSKYFLGEHSDIVADNLIWPWKS